MTARAAAGRGPVAAAGSGRIGPNASLQLVPVLDGSLGADMRGRILARAGIAPAR